MPSEPVYRHNGSFLEATDCTDERSSFEDELELGEARVSIETQCALGKHYPLRRLGMCRMERGNLGINLHNQCHFNSHV